MSLRKLVEGECGGTNSLVSLSSHFVQDRGLKDEGFHSFPHQDSLPNTNVDQVCILINCAYGFVDFNLYCGLFLVGARVF